MDKNAAAELHRGDTVKTNGPPSYNSAVARGLVASRSASAPTQREKQLPITPESSSSSSQALLPLLSPPRRLSNPNPPLAVQAHSSPAPTSLSARSQSYFDTSPSTVAPTPPFMRNSASQSHIAPRTVHSTSSIGSYGRNQRSTPSSPSQSSTDPEGMYSPDIVYLMDSHALTDAPIINGLHLVQKEPIVGSWRLDVDFPRVSKSSPKTKRPRRARKAMCEDPNLSFETKAGNIAAQLAIIGRASYESRKAFLRVTSRAGKVNIDIKEQTQGRYFDLDVYNKSGETIILIPRSFRGVIDLYSSQGRVVIRPALAGVARTLKSSKEEMLLLVGNASADEREHMDFVRFNSEGGAPVVVGFTVEDDITVSAPGFWRKFGLMLQGKSTRAIEKSAIPEPI